ncbi:hypothetical protein Tco_1474066 [Tanacetum coccineum]
MSHVLIANGIVGDCQRGYLGCQRCQYYASRRTGERILDGFSLLRNTKDMFLVYDGNPEAELRVDCYCNAGFETDRDDTKSQTRYVFILNRGVID